MRDLEGKTVHSSVSLNSCSPTCSAPYSDPHCAKMSPCLTRAKITRGTPAYATQSTGHGTVRTRYFPGVCLAAPMAFSLALLRPFTSAFYHTYQSLTHRQNWGLHHRNSQLSQEEPQKIRSAYHQSLHGGAINMSKLILSSCQPRSTMNSAACCPQSYDPDAIKEQTLLCTWKEAGIHCQNPNCIGKVWNGSVQPVHMPSLAL